MNIIMGEKISIIVFIVLFCVFFPMSSWVKTNFPVNISSKEKTSKKQISYSEYGYNIEGSLYKYKSALKNVNKEKVNIYCIGESNTRGEYSSDEVNRSWVGVMKSLLQNQYGNAGEGFISVYEGALPEGTKPRWTLGSGWSVSGASKEFTYNVGGFGGCFAISSGNKSPLALEFIGTDLELLYSRAKDGGTAGIVIDGKKVGNINCLGESVSFSNKAYYSGLSDEKHELKVIPNTTSNVFVEGAFALSGKTGIEVDKIAISSKMASYFTGNFTEEVWNVSRKPTLVLLSFGLNEAGNGVSFKEYKESMIGLVSYWQKRGSDVCLVSNQKPADSWSNNWPDYIKVLYEIADEYNVGVIDIYKAYFEDYAAAQKLGLFGVDKNDYSGNSGRNTAHPSDKGYEYIGEVIYENLKL